MVCDDVTTLLDAYVDRELDVVQDLAMAGHLQTCPPCAQQYEARLALQDTVRTRGTYFTSPPALRQRLRRTLRDAAPAPFLRRTRAALAAGGLLVVVLGSMVMWFYRLPPTRADGRVREVVAAHVRSLQVDHLMDVASADTHTLKPWLSDKLAFVPPVRDLAPQGFPLLGARLDYLHDRAVAALVYRRRQHHINLWIAPADPAPAMAAGLATRHGYHVLHWVYADMAYWAVSDLNPHELQRLKQLLHAP